MSEQTFDEICRWLEENEFRRVSSNGENDWVYSNNDNSLTVTVSQNYFTKEDEETVKERLKQLGYLI